KVSGRFFVAGGEGAELLEFGKEVLDKMAFFIKLFVDVALDFAVLFGRDDNFLSRLSERREETFVGIKCPIGKNRVRRDVRQESVGSFQIMGLTGRQNKIDGIAQSIHDSMNLGAQIG